MLLSGCNSKAAALKMTLCFLSFDGRPLCDTCTVPRPIHIYMRHSLPRTCLRPVKKTGNHYSLSQTVPVVPPHLAEDGIALVSPSSLYLAWGKSPFTHTPISRKAFLFTPVQLQALELVWTSRGMVVPQGEITAEQVGRLGGVRMCICRQAQSEST